jgi:hypothetical protein
MSPTRTATPLSINRQESISVAKRLVVDPRTTELGGSLNDVSYGNNNAYTNKRCATCLAALSIWSYTIRKKISMVYVSTVDY